MCSRCRSFHADPADKMTAHGFGRCAHLDAWHYRSRCAPVCHFDPPRFQEAKAK